MNLGNFLGNIFGSIGRVFGVAPKQQQQRPVVAPPLMLRKPQQQQPAPPQDLGAFLAQQFGQATNQVSRNVGNAVNQASRTAGQVGNQVARQALNIPNIRIRELEQGWEALNPGKTSGPIRIGDIKKIPVIGDPIRFAQQQQLANARGEMPNVGNFVQSVGKTGAQAAAFVAPQMGIVKLAPGAGLLAKGGAKLVNNFAPGAATSAIADVATGNRDLAKIAQNAGIAGAGNAIISAALPAGKVAIRGIKRTVQDAAPGVRGVLNESGHIGLPGGKQTTPSTIKAQNALEQATAPMKKTRYASQTIPDSDFVSQPIKDATAKNAPLYTPETERNGMLDAGNRLLAQGDDAFENTVRKNLDKADGTITRQEAIDAQVYAQRLESSSDELSISKASDIYDKLSLHYTKAGQLIQAARTMARRSPAGMMSFANKQFSKAGVKVTPKIQGQINEAVARLSKTLPDTEANAQAIDELLHVISKNIPQSKADLFINTWRANLLTAPTTTLGGFVGGVDTFVNRKLWTNPIGTLVDMVTSLFTGKRSMTMAGGFTGGAKKGIKTGLSKQYWKTGYDEIDGIAKGTKYDQPRDINFGDSTGGRALGGYVNGVYRTMGVVDKPWKYGAQGEALRSIAKAEGLNAGYKGQQLKQYIDEFIDSPPEAALNRANAEGKYAVFQDETALGEAAGAVSNYFRKKGWNGAAAIVDFIVPFKSIPGSIATRLVRRTPIGAAENIVKQIVTVKKGGQFDQRAFSQAMAEGSSGIPIVAAGYALAQAGQITGAFPSDDKERKLWQAEGKQPNSVKIGDRWYSLNYIQPFGALLNVGAGALQADKDGKDGMDVVWAGLGEGGKSIADMSFLKGVSGAVDALKNPDYAGERFVANTGSSLVPNFIRSFAAASDTHQRQASGVLQGIQSGIPGLRQMLPAKKDALGNEVATQDSFVNRYINPLKPSKVIDNGVVAELRRLQDAEVGIMPSESKATVFGANHKLDKTQLNDLNARIAKDVSDAWTTAMANPKYQALSDEDKKKTLKAIKTDYANLAKAYWAADNNMISDEWEPKLTAAQKGIGMGAARDYFDPKVTGKPNLNAMIKKAATESVTSKYSPDVVAFSKLSKAQQSEMFRTDPQRAKALYDQAKLMKGELSGSKPSKAKVSTTKRVSTTRRTSTAKRTTRAKTTRSRTAKVKVARPTPPPKLAIKTVKLSGFSNKPVSVSKARPITVKSQTAKIGKVKQLTA
jgi:hypothetical protein